MPRKPLALPLLHTSLYFYLNISCPLPLFELSTMSPTLPTPLLPRLLSEFESATVSITVQCLNVVPPRTIHFCPLPPFFALFVYIYPYALHAILFYKSH